MPPFSTMTPHATARAPTPIATAAAAAAVAEAPGKAWSHNPYAARVLPQPLPLAAARRTGMKEYWHFVPRSKPERTVLLAAPIATAADLERVTLAVLQACRSVAALEEAMRAAGADWLNRHVGVQRAALGRDAPRIVMPCKASADVLRALLGGLPAPA